MSAPNSQMTKDDIEFARRYLKEIILTIADGGKSIGKSEAEVSMVRASTGPAVDALCDLALKGLYGPSDGPKTYGDIAEAAGEGPCLRCVGKAVVGPEEVSPGNAALQAKIDALMLEYCPEEMTPERIKNWERHQIAAGPEAKAHLDRLVASLNNAAPQGSATSAQSPGRDTGVAPAVAVPQPEAGNSTAQIIDPLPPTVMEAINSYGRYYAKHHKLGMSVRDDMKYIASVAIRSTNTLPLDKITSVTRAFDYESPDKHTPWVKVCFPLADWDARDAFAKALHVPDATDMSGT